jgi:hypothetical protein
VIIGVDPHKSTHAAVAVDRDGRTLARLRLVADGCHKEASISRPVVLHRPSERRGPARSSNRYGSLASHVVVVGLVPLGTEQ